ncbi:MAG: protein-S-isoprenylcysteine O-methyltransferase [Pseudomonadota bacterium]
MDIVKKVVLPLIAIGLITVIVWRAPINGWESLVWLAGMVVMGVVRRPHENANKQNTISASRQNAMENGLLVCVFIGSALLPVLQLTLGLFTFAGYTLPLWLSMIGAIVLVFGLWLFWRSHADLGRNWSVSLEIREGHTLISEGVYKSVRHPMYSAIFFIFVSQALLIHNWIAGIGGIASFTLMYFIRVPREEAMMREQFGDEYLEYSRTTGRIFPKL